MKVLLQNLEQVNPKENRRDVSKVYLVLVWMSLLNFGLRGQTKEKVHFTGLIVNTIRVEVPVTF